VDFPLENLNLAQWVVSAEEKKAAVYDLYAVSNHFGGLGGGACLVPSARSFFGLCLAPDLRVFRLVWCAGHYTAYAKNLIDKKWYNLDDSSVGPVDRIQTPAAYVLFYHRKKPRFPEGACSVPQKKA
jgi:ubiquitin carboxyl-terminal hydrolase 4/11/15